MYIYIHIYIYIYYGTYYFGAVFFERHKNSFPQITADTARIERSIINMMVSV